MCALPAAATALHSLEKEVEVGTCEHAPFEGAAPPLTPSSVLSESLPHCARRRATKMEGRFLVPVTSLKGERGFEYRYSGANTAHAAT